jgi:hypothetical protein
MSRTELEELASRAEHLMRLLKRQFLTEEEYSRRFNELRLDYGLSPLAVRKCPESLTAS